MARLPRDPLLYLITLRTHTSAKSGVFLPVLSVRISMCGEGNSASSNGQTRGDAAPNPFLRRAVPVLSKTIFIA